MRLLTVLLAASVLLVAAIGVGYSAGFEDGAAAVPGLRGTLERCVDVTEETLALVWGAREVQAEWIALRNEALSDSVEVRADE